MRKLFVCIVSLLVLISVTGCGRNVSDVKGAIIGHWTVTERNGKAFEKEIHLYYNKDNVTSVDANGTEKNEEYKILESNEKEGTLAIITKDAEGRPFREDFKFLNNERTEVLRTVGVKNLKVTENMTAKEKESIETAKKLMGDFEIKEKLKYVDSKMTSGK